MTGWVRRKGYRWGRRDMISRMSMVVGAAGCWSGVVSGVVSDVSLLMARLSINALWSWSAAAGALEHAEIGAPRANSPACLPTRIATPLARGALRLAHWSTPR